MGNAQSQQSAAFSGVLPGSDGRSVPTMSASSTKSGVPSSATAPHPLADDTLRSPVSVASSASSPSTNDTLQIQTPAHALTLAGAVPVAARRAGDDMLTSREGAGVRDSEFAIPESVRKARILDEFAGVCSEILPQFLYVSSLEVARDRSKLRALGITHIVNCCKELCASTPPSSQSAFDTQMQSLELALRDDVHEDLSWFFHPVIAFIQSALDSPPSRVLVHCHQGVSRSCAFAIAFVMRQQQQQQPVSFRDAMAFVKSRRPIASPNTAFLCQLIEWERELSTSEASLASRVLPENTLYRLAPHAAHDPTTLVLKSCFRPEATAHRQKVIVPLDESGSDGAPRHWLFARGIFVFLRRALHGACKVVIWRGSACDLPSGVARARELVGQMVRVRLASPAHVDVEIVDEDPAGAALIDHFGYATELDWVTRKDAARTASSSSVGASVWSTDAVPSHNSRELSESIDALKLDRLGDSDTSTQKPLLLLLEAIGDDADSGGSWDHLKVYDSEDLTPSDAFLLVLPPLSSHHFVWVGDACSFETAAVVRCAERHVFTRVGAEASRASEIRVEQGGAESDAFWAAFERGY